MDDIFGFREWVSMKKNLFRIVMSYTLSSNNLESKICPILLLNLAPKLKFAKYWQVTQGIIEYLRSFKLFVGTYITFLKGYDAGYPKILKIISL
jgi:hypothetical protein